MRNIQIQQSRSFSPKRFFCTFVGATLLLICPLKTLAITNSIYITSFDRTGQLTWTNSTPVAFPVTITNSVYQISTAANLSGSWQILPGYDAIRPSNSLATILITPINADKQFYRVSVTNPVLADSIADFSGTQGKNNWYYGYYDGTSATPWTTGDFKLMTNYTSSTWYVLDGTYWTRLWDSGGHPNGVTTSGGRKKVNQWAVRRWVSNVTGLIYLYGTVLDNNPNNGNGVICHVIADSTEVANYNIDNGGGTNIAVTISVSLGSLVDFAIDPKDGNDLNDSTDFYVTIQQ